MTVKVDAIFRRASTYTEIVFYNKFVVDPYILACHGYVKKSEKVATCEACHKQIEFDGDEMTPMKDRLSEAL